MSGAFPELLMAWYARNKRDLPWRNTRNPYFIWLSEVILQQTRVQQGLPYYLRFVETYPTVQALANAQEQDVLRLWQGLGYYSRARNMHATAKLVVERFNGVFPTDYATLLTLKGIGEYTAAAIASFSANEAVAVLDGNVFRVLARLFGVAEDIASPKGKKVFKQLAAEWLPAAQAATYNQAIMEFGATHCRPANPDCLFCPFAEFCEARLQQKQNQLPVKVKKLKIKQRFLYYLVYEQNGNYWLKARQAGDIWQGLYDFPAIETAAELTEEDLAQAIVQELPHVAEWRFAGGVLKHILTHQQLFIRFIQISGEGLHKHTPFATCGSYGKVQIADLPKPVPITKFFEGSGA